MRLFRSGPAHNPSVPTTHQPVGGPIVAPRAPGKAPRLVTAISETVGGPTFLATLPFFHLPAVATILAVGAAVGATIKGFIDLKSNRDDAALSHLDRELAIQQKYDVTGKGFQTREIIKTITRKNEGPRDGSHTSIFVRE